MTRLALAALALAAATACGSSAPYTVPAAALNTGIALGLAGAERAKGGCYAVCAYAMLRLFEAEGRRRASLETM
jgi:hypothetical protein